MMCKSENESVPSCLRAIICMIRFWSAKIRRTLMYISISNNRTEHISGHLSSKEVHC